MDKVDQLKELLKELTPEEVEQFKAFLDSEDKKPSEEAVQNDESNTEPTIEDGNKTEEFDDVSEKSESEKEVAQADEIPSESVDSLEEKETLQKETEDDKFSEEEQSADEQSSISEEDDIPKMQKGVECSDGETESQQITDETGENIPVDYEQVVEGLNARIAALEAENASLKNKVDGAFGYSAKPTMPVKTNRLYDECSDVHFHK